jgi:SpoVK/Ycf46/Vps4 family AAA+-type ATPase
VAEIQAKVHSMVGMEHIAGQFDDLLDTAIVNQRRQAAGLPVESDTNHLIFSGPPGTGKTTIARELAQAYHAMGITPTDKFTEVSRADLVGEYLGQSAPKSRKVFNQAKGGVLFIDEAYALVQGGEQDFGREAIAVLLKQMEDHRDDVVVIVAGYPAPMTEFLDANPGIRSRFPKTLEFPDYTDDEMVAICDSMAKTSHYELDASARERLRAWLGRQPRGASFGNARLVRNVFEQSVTRQASRVVDLPSVTDHQLMTLTAADIPD